MASPPRTPTEPTSTTPPHPRRRQSRPTSVSSSFSSSILSTPSPSHFSIQTPFHPLSSSIPFSWEQSPGIPKLPSKTLKSYSYPRLLPPPPPPRSASFPATKHVDPFAAALAECAKDVPVESDLWIGSRASEAKSRRRFWISDWFGFGFGFAFGLGSLDPYGSCKASCAVTESTVQISRVGPQAGSYRVVGRRVG